MGARLARLKSCPFKALTFPALILLVLTVASGHAQSPSQASPPESDAQNAQEQAAPAKAAPAPPADAKPAPQPRGSDRRRAIKLFLEASKLFEKEQFEAAMEGYRKAASLDPENRDYPAAAEVARSHAVTALIQAANKARMKGDKAAERAALARALDLDGKNPEVAEHLRELGDDELRGMEKPLYDQSSSDAGEPEKLEPTPGTHSFHLRTDQRNILLQVYKAWGIQVTVDDSVRPTQTRLDIDDASFPEAMRIVGLITDSFYVALDAHRALVARDTPENRRQYTRQELETVYLPGLSTTELTEVGNLAKNIFEAQQAVVEQSAGTLTVRAPAATLAAINSTLRDLIDGRSQVMLDVRIIELAHNNDRTTGLSPPQTLTTYNLYAEEQQILSQNAALVQQIVSSGLAAPGDTEAIIAILIASGQVTSSLFTQGFAVFGGGLTLSAISTPPITVNLSLNSSDSRELDEVQLRLGDGEAGTLKAGSKYPIMTASFSSLAAGGVNIPGLNSPGTSGALGGLGGLAGLAGLGGAGLNVPQVQYQDLGLTLKATPNVMRNGDVALTIDLKIDALGGSSINNVPILNNRSYQGVVTLRQGETVVVAGEMDKSEMRNISGVPGLSEIPGLNNVTDKDVTKNSATLLIVMTPHVIRGTQAGGHSPMMRVEKATSVR